MLQMQPTKQKTNLKTKEPWGARCRGVLQYAPTQLMSGLGVTLVAHTHLKGSVWSTSPYVPSQTTLRPLENCTKKMNCLQQC